MHRILKILFFAFLVRPFVLVALGLNIRGRNRLPFDGPAILAANHNSHMDTMVLMSLYPLCRLHKLRPVAAADYFLSNPLLAWFSLNVIGIIPLARDGSAEREHLFDGCHKALDEGDIVILFPEGSRGGTGELGQIKKGLYHLVKQRDDVSVTPVVMHGLNRVLPKGEALLVPFNVDVVVGEPLSGWASADAFVSQLADVYRALFEHCLTRNLIE
jgi:1-acyl-sn-glycerol-3-phosphate acyltransferase